MKGLKKLVDNLTKAEASSEVLFDIIQKPLKKIAKNLNLLFLFDT
jgi:hypothetical protein